MRAYVAISNLWSAAEKDSLTLTVIRAPGGGVARRDTSALERGIRGRSIGRDSVYVDPTTFGFFYVRRLPRDGAAAFNDTVFVQCRTTRCPPVTYPDTLKGIVLSRLRDKSGLGPALQVSSNIEFINFRSTGTRHRVE